jgi:D-alanyl-D-alanine carboxypeptidase
MKINKKIIVLWSICVALILSATYIRVNEKLKTFPGESKIIPKEYAEPDISSDFYNTENPDAPPSQPQKTKSPSPVSAKAFIVGNVETGDIYMYRNMETVLPVASMSKLITAIASIDQYSLSGTTTVLQSNMDRPDSLTYRDGEIFSVEDSLKPLLISSSNIMAEALASTSDRSKFMNLMSSYAWEIGMPATYFADPSGISPMNISTAKDFFALAQYLYKRRPDILTITKTPNIDLATTTEHDFHHIVSTHPFVGYSNFLGGKTGRTPQAKDTMLTILSIRNIPVAFVVLGSENRKTDTEYLIKQADFMLSQLSE